MNLIDCAIKMEEEAGMHYRRLAESADNEELKNLFTLLAETEQEHHAALMKLKAGMGSPETEPEGLRETPCLLQPVLARRELLAELKKAPDAYQMVVGQEQKGIDFYEKLAAEATDGRTREILLEIAAQARRHLSIVENLYFFVESPKNFLASGEFSNLKEY